VRVIGGAFKGRRLEAPTWEGLRPTSDKLRETLFNVLAARTPGARVLDGFAGTGAVGLEALSRGAASVTFVESDPRALRLIARNLERCGVTTGYTLVRAPFSEAARRLPAGGFDLVLLDPPYGRDHQIEALTAGALLVAPGGRLILEHARRDLAPTSAASLVKFRDILSGDSALTIYGEPEPTGAV
jgi:16S rRNA (guanine966-N2)-methyltransferase